MSTPSATPYMSPFDAAGDPWRAQLAELAAYVEEHQGFLPSTRSDDPYIAGLASWWVAQNSDANRARMSEDAVAQLDALRERADRLRADVPWAERVDALTAYVRTHEGRFPPNRSADPQVAALGCWWVAQNIALTRQRMPPDLYQRLEDLRGLAAELRAEARARRAAQAREAARARSRAVSLAAARAGAVAAAQALHSPYLVPGDVQVLQLRIDHPDKSLSELAELAGVTHGQFTAKYYGALHRGPHSRSPLKKALKDRVLPPGEAATLIGVPRVTLARWTNAGLVSAEVNSMGHRRYSGGEVLRVKDLIGDGWPAEFKEAAEGHRRK
jgi:hypothetical protein